MAFHYLIDGYNLLHVSPQLKGILQQNLEAAREALIEQAAQFAAVSPNPVTLVFDGRGGHYATSDTHPGAPSLEIVYSPEKHSADTVIERLVYIAPQRNELVVVTGDGGLRDLVRGLGAFSMKPESFLTTVWEARNRTSGQLEKDYSGNQLARIEERLDQSAIALLRKLRGRLK